MKGLPVKPVNAAISIWFYNFEMKCNKTTFGINFLL